MHSNVIYPTDIKYHALAYIPKDISTINLPRIVLPFLIVQLFTLIQAYLLKKSTYKTLMNLLTMNQTYSKLSSR